MPSRLNPTIANGHLRMVLLRKVCVSPLRAKVLAHGCGVKLSRSDEERIGSG